MTAVMCIAGKSFNHFAMDSIFTWLNSLDSTQVISLVQACATALLGLAAGWIAFNQFRVNRERLRMELYDREVKVVHTVLSVFQDASTPEEITEPVPEVPSLLGVMPELTTLFPRALAWEILSASEELDKRYKAALNRKGGLPFQLADEDIKWAGKKYWEYSTRLGSAMSTTRGWGVQEWLIARIGKILTAGLNAVIKLTQWTCKSVSRAWRKDK